MEVATGFHAEGSPSESNLRFSRLPIQGRDERFSDFQFNDPKGGSHD